MAAWKFETAGGVEDHVGTDQRKKGESGMTEKIKVESLEIITRMIKDEPYYEIKYKEVGKSYYNIGHSSYNLENVLKWKEECFEFVGKKETSRDGMTEKTIMRSEVIRAVLLSGTDMKIVSNDENIEYIDAAIDALEEIQQYRSIGTVEECRAAMEKQKGNKDLESHDEKHILKYCISLMWELVGKFEEWYEYVHGEDAFKELDEQERFCYRMSYFNIVQELFLFSTSHSGGTSTRAKCKQLGVDSSDGVEFSFGDDEE